LPRAVGGELHGSPLPLRPNAEALESELVELPDIASFTQVPGEGLSTNRDGQSAGSRHATAPGKAAESGLSSHG
jgi:hypothetical protein